MAVAFYSGVCSIEWASAAPRGAHCDRDMFGTWGSSTVRSLYIYFRRLRAACYWKTAGLRPIELRQRLVALEIRGRRKFRGFLDQLRARLVMPELSRLTLPPHRRPLAAVAPTNWALNRPTPSKLTPPRTPDRARASHVVASSTTNAAARGRPPWGLASRGFHPLVDLAPQLYARMSE